LPQQNAQRKLGIFVPVVILSLARAPARRGEGSAVAFSITHDKSPEQTGLFF
jgi:hypothetical protein